MKIDIKDDIKVTNRLTDLIMNHYGTTVDLSQNDMPEFEHNERDVEYTIDHKNDLFQIVGTFTVKGNLILVGRNGGCVALFGTDDQREFQLIDVDNDKVRSNLEELCWAFKGTVFLSRIDKIKMVSTVEL